jgi:hypothetical protein
MRVFFYVDTLNCTPLRHNKPSYRGKSSSVVYFNFGINPSLFGFDSLLIMNYVF